jgi:hypothetical protein
VTGRRRSITVVWLLLVAVTLVSWAIGAHEHINGNSAITFTVLTIAFLKVRLVMFHFMEVRFAPLPLKIPCNAWVILVGTGLLALYVMSKAN